VSRGVTDSGKNCYGTPISDLKAKTAKEKELLLSKFSDKVSGYNIMWECKWNIFRNENKTLIDEFWRRSKLDPMRPLKRLIPRVSVRGGFVELYRLSFQSRVATLEAKVISDTFSATSSRFTGPVNVAPAKAAYEAAAALVSSCV
jgi:hypothetical protein